MPPARLSIAGLALLGVVVLGACGSSSKPSAATSAPSASTTATAKAATTAAKAATTAAKAATTAAAAGTTTAAATVTGSLAAVDQTSDGKTITVKAVNIKGAKGFIAVHADVSGAPGPVVGHVAIPEGDSSNVVVKLDSTVASGSYWPMLHLDAGTIGTYEFPGPDGPVKDSAGIVMKQIKVTVG